MYKIAATPRCLILFIGIGTIFYLFRSSTRNSTGLGTPLKRLSLSEVHGNTISRKWIMFRDQNKNINNILKAFNFLEKSLMKLMLDLSVLKSSLLFRFN